MPNALLASTSEIDDIFGSSSGSKNAKKGAMKGAVVAQPTATLSASVNELSSSPSKKKRKKGKNVAGDTVTTNMSSRVALSAAIASASSTEETPPTKTKNKKKKKTLTNSDEVQGDNEDDACTKSTSSSQSALLGPASTSSTKKKRPAPETVLDPSARIEFKAAASGSLKKRRVEQNNVTGGAGSGSEGRLYIHSNNSDDERFRDSRGTGPRKSRHIALPIIVSQSIKPDAGPLGRRTEEGYLVYKEDELGIQEDGGGESF